MKNIIEDLISFFQSITLFDFFFFAAIIALIILIVVLIYIIKINNDGEEMYEEVDNNQEEDNLNNNVSLINDNDELDLKQISTAIAEETPKPINLNAYEKEQEQKAIISYDELVAKEKDAEEINYKTEEDIAGLKVKAVDMDNLTKPIELPKMKEATKIINEDIPLEQSKNSVLISYAKEEAFLEALKKLQSLLN